MQTYILKTKSIGKSTKLPSLEVVDLSNLYLITFSQGSFFSLLVLIAYPLWWREYIQWWGMVMTMLAPIHATIKGVQQLKYSLPRYAGYVTLPMFFIVKDNISQPS